MEIVVAFIRTYNEVIILAALGLSILLIVLLTGNLYRIGKVVKKYNQLMKGMEGKNLEEMLTSHHKAVNKVFSKTLEIESEYKSARKMAEKAVQRVEVIRFNAFDDTGSDLSFAVAMLDSFGDGVVISSLFARDETRTYAKPVSKGQSTYKLSEEEKQVIGRAMDKNVY